MKIEFNEALRNRTIAFCKDELNYHINESGCPDEYHDETCAEIEILYRLGEERSAGNYKRQYLEVITEQIEDEYNRNRKKELRAMKKELEEFWKALVA